MKSLPTEGFVLDGEKIDLGSEDRDYLLQSKLRIDALIQTVRAKVVDAKRKFAKGGAPSDIDWLRRAEGMQHAASRASQRVQARLGELKRLHAAANVERENAALADRISRRGEARTRAGVFAQCFVDAAEMLLDQETFDKLWEIADRKAGPNPRTEERA